jgi:hypothetical protein
MDINDLDLKVCLRDLDPSKARFSSNASTLVPLGDMDEVVIEWGPFSTAKSVSQYKAFLRHFTWPTNAEHTPAVAKSYVEGDEPEEVALYVEGQPLHGRWRQAFVRERRQESRPGQVEYYVLLTLRKGFASALAEDEARLGRCVAMPNRNTYLFERYWPNVENVQVEPLVHALRSTASVTDPQMEGVPRAGTFPVGRVEGDKSDEDGAGVVRQWLVAPLGDGVVLSYKTNCDTKVDITFKHDLTEAQVKALDDSYANATNGVSVRIQSSFNGETGLYDAVVTLETTQYREYPTSAATAAFADGIPGEDGLYEKRRTFTQLGIANETTNPKRVVTREAGYVKRQTERVREDCSKDVVTEEIQAQTILNARASSTATAEYVEASATDRNEAAAETAETAHEAGKLETVETVKNDFEKFDNTKMTRTFTDGKISNEGGTDPAESAAGNSVAAYTSVKNRDMTATHRVYRHSSTQPTLTESFGTLSLHKDPVSGRWMGDKTVVTYRGGGAIIGPTAKTDLTRKLIQEKDWPGETTAGAERIKYRVVTCTYSITYHADESAAQDEISGSLQISGFSPAVWKAIGALWGALKITQIAYGNWTAGQGPIT